MSRMFPPMDPYISTAARPKIHIDRRVIPGAPKSLDGLRLCFASDLHLRASMDPGVIAEAIRACNADLLLLGGDFADTRAQALRMFGALRGLRAPLGIFAACGNNDIEAFETHEALSDALSAFGARLLVNESAEAAGMLIGGIDDYRHCSPDYAPIFKEKRGYRLLLSHYPILPDAAPDEMPDLMLCGHTHGGQFNFLGLTPYSIGFEHVGRKKYLAPARVSGMQATGRTTLLVSKGVGTSRIHVRIGVRPEIHLLELKC